MTSQRGLEVRGAAGCGFESRPVRESAPTQSPTGALIVEEPSDMNILLPGIPPSAATVTLTVTESSSPTVQLSPGLDLASLLVFVEESGIY